MSAAFVISLVAALAIAVSALALALWLRARALATALRSEREETALLRADLQRHDARAHLLLSVADTLPAAAWTCEGCAQLVELLPDVDELLTSEGQRRLELARHTQSHHERIAHDLRQLSQNLNRLHQETQRASVEAVPHPQRRTPMKTRSTLKFGQPIKPAEPVSTPVVAQPGAQASTTPAPAAPPVDQQKSPSPKK